MKGLFIFFIPWFSLVKELWSFFSPPCCFNYSGSVAFCGDRISGILVIFTKKPVITQTALLPSSHASCTLQAQWSVNVSVAGCLSSSLSHALSFTQKEDRIHSLKEYKVEKWPAGFACRCWKMANDPVMLLTLKQQNTVVRVILPPLSKCLRTLSCVTMSDL